MKPVDEPVLDLASEESGEPHRSGPEAGRCILRLMDSQPFAVLCAQGSGQPYGAVVAFACLPDLTALAFPTPITTRKFRLLEASAQVALVIDSRSLHPDDMMKVEAVTVTGRATLLEEPEARREWSRRIADRHAYLRDFLQSPSTAVFRVDVCRYFYVTRFQEVMQWIPGRTG
ncbi:MAG: pyridoxamine 5'-phosphate oxidase family protein [Gammaproteobacteria bacterium]|nr:pyridoxamine 5'-phosphate oxidase family protein [Gammaproteobacteria bacterium]